MKIRKVLDKKVGKSSYYKYVITIPKEVVERSELFNKQLKSRSEKGKIIIEKE